MDWILGCNINVMLVRYRRVYVRTPWRKRCAGSDHGYSLMCINIYFFGGFYIPLEVYNVHTAYTVYTPGSAWTTHIYVVTRLPNERYYIRTRCISNFIFIKWSLGQIIMCACEHPLHTQGCGCIRISSPVHLRWLVIVVQTPHTRCAHHSTTHTTSAVIEYT